MTDGKILYNVLTYLLLGESNGRENQMEINVRVKGKRQEDLNRAIRKLKRKIEDAGVIKDIKDRKHFKKPSVKKREKMAAARARTAIIARENR